MADLFKTAERGSAYLDFMRRWCEVAGLALLTLSLEGRAIPQTKAGAPPPDQGENATVESRTLSVRIDRPFAVVYDFLPDPAHWNAWAFGLGRSLRRSDDGWIANSGGGLVHIQFTPRNDFGIVDHTVTRVSGRAVYVPMRLIANDRGCELLFTLFREPGATETQFRADADFVQSDPDRLKGLLEK